MLMSLLPGSMDAGRIFYSSIVIPLIKPYIGTWYNIRLYNIDVQESHHEIFIATKNTQNMKKRRGDVHIYTFRKISKQKKERHKHRLEIYIYMNIF